MYPTKKGPNGGSLFLLNKAWFVHPIDKIAFGFIIVPGFTIPNNQQIGVSCYF